MNPPILSINDKLYILRKYLLHFIAEKTVDSWSKSGTIQRLTEPGCTYFAYDSLPDQSKKKLPTEVELKAIAKGELQNVAVSQAEIALKDALQHRYYHWFNLFQNSEKYKALSIVQKQEAAVKGSLFEHLLTLSGFGKIKAAFEAYNKISAKKYESVPAFHNALNKARKKGVEALAVDRRAMKEPKALTCLDARISKLLYDLVASPVKHTDSQIHQLLTRYCLAEDIAFTYSKEWVKKQRRLMLQNLQVYSNRYGAKAAFNNRQPYAKLIRAKHANSKWVIDGFTVPMYYGKAGEYKKKILFAVQDEHSRKFVGYAIVDSESAASFMAAFRDAVKQTGYLPGELVCDNGAFNKTDEATELKRRLESYGVHYTVTSNPREKIIERTFRHFNEHFLKQYPGWGGQGVLSKDKNGRPAPEYFDQYQKQAHRLTEEQISIYIIDAVKNYNSEVLPKLEQSPNNLYDQSEKPHAIEFDVFQQAKFFATVNQSQRPVERGQINITRGGIKHEYQLNAELIQRLNGQKVTVRWEALEEGIYVYDLKTDAPYGFIEPKVGIHSAKVDQTDRDKELLNKNSGRLKGLHSKSIKEVQANIHPDAYVDVNKLTASKDVLKILEEAHVRHRAADMGIDLKGVSNANPVEDRLSAVAAYQEKKAKRAPFQISEHQISVSKDESEEY